MFQQIAGRVALALAGVVSVIIALKLISAFLTPILGPALMSSVLAAASLLWGFLTPGLTALLALLMLGGLWWLFMSRRRR